MPGGELKDSIECSGFRQIIPDMINRLAATVLLFAFLSGLSSCTGRKDADIAFKVPGIRIPIVSHPPSKGCYLYDTSDSMENSLALFAGKFKFSDSITLSYYGDSLLKDRFDGFPSERLQDSISSDGFLVIPDYKTTVTDTANHETGIRYFPVFLVNETTKPKLVEGRNEDVDAIQEARDSNGDWRPIESRRELNYWCGPSIWGLLVQPKEFITVLMAKYQGTYKTQLRIRVRVGDCVYVSAPFEGTIPYSKFYFKWWTMEHQFLATDEYSAIKFQFLGAYVFYDRKSKKEQAFRELVKSGKDSIAERFFRDLKIKRGIDPKRLH